MQLLKNYYFLILLPKDSQPKIQYLVEIQGTDEFPPKPDPEVLRRCMQGLGIENAIMFGDRKEDIRAAKTLGIPSIGIAQSAHSVQDLLAEGATYSFSNFTELGLHLHQIIELIKKV